jgi:hypothetical protein
LTPAATRKLGGPVGPNPARGQLEERVAAIEEKVDRLADGQVEISRQLELLISMSKSKRRSSAGSRDRALNPLNPTRRPSRGVDPYTGEPLIVSQDIMSSNINNFVRAADHDRDETKTEEPSAPNLGMEGSADLSQQPLADNDSTMPMSDTQESSGSADAGAESDDSADSADEKKSRAINQFRLIDTNGNRRLDLDEILSGAKILGLTDNEAKTLFNKIDKDNSDEVELEKFLQMYEHMRATTLSDMSSTSIKRRASAWMVNPRSNVRISWDLTVMMPLLLYLLVMLPFRFAFNNEARIYTWIYWFESIIGKSSNDSQSAAPLPSSVLSPKSYFWFSSPCGRHSRRAVCW